MARQKPSKTSEEWMFGILFVISLLLLSAYLIFAINS